MRPDERQQRLDRMRKEIRKAHYERQSTLEVLRDELDAELLDRSKQTPRTPPHRINEILNKASDRGMLEKVKFENQFGEESREIAFVKDREPYGKRPSIRAMKKSLENKGPDV